jgi:protein O-GlcNAc transferase
MSAGNKGSSWWSRLRGKSAGQVTGNAGHVVAADDAQTLQAEFEQGAEHHRQGRLDEAEAVYRSLLERQPKAAEVLHSMGVLQVQRQNLADAVVWMERAAEADPRHVAARVNLGNLLRVLGHREEALASYGGALDIAPGNIDALMNRAAVLLDLGRQTHALADYESVLNAMPGHREAGLKRCILLTGQGRMEEALAGYDQVLASSPEDLEALFNQGALLVALDRVAEAVASYDRALAIKPDFVEVFNNRGIAWWKGRQCESAVADYERALALRPDYAEAHHNRGIVLAYMRRWDEALTSYDRAVACNPGYSGAWGNRGALLADMGRHDEALFSYDRALEIKPDFLEALNNRGGIFRKMALHERSAQDYSQILALNPGYEHAIGNKWYAEALVCNWTGYPDSRQSLFDAIKSDAAVALPFQAAVLLGSADSQLQCARNFVRRKYPAIAEPLWNGESYRHARPRVAYLSADFHDHATSQLMAELFERHDRERFEVSAWSFGPETGDAMRARLRAAFEHFHDVRNVSDDEVAARLRAAEIDIAVDLKGFTDGCRPGIFARRVAPIQVNFLGYPGTTGADYMDYIIGDAEVIPEGHEVFYSEQVVRLPDSYQVNDTKRVIAGHVPTRAEAGLPASGFVFCCFNNNYKITPEVFDVWMRLLKAVPGSVLWLLEDNAAASRNLRREAQARGVDAGRLVFAGRVLPPDHLARHRLADLFLDTLPCNAHTTASDALWAGLPVLTCRGNAFAGRVAASLLRAVGLPELVVDDLGAYETLAMRLATAPGELAGLKARLLQNRLTHPLFDIERYRRHLESAYAAMIEQHRQGKSPRGFSVAPPY